MERVTICLLAAVFAGCGAAHHETHTVTATESAMCHADDACGPGARCVAGQCMRAVTTENLPPPRVAEAPEACQLGNVYYAFDSSALDPQDAAVADRDAVCLQRPSNQSGRIVIVGRTDPRGSTEYNLALGERRAATLAHQLERNGVQASRIVTQSVGSEYASGTDEASWARDRFAGFSPPR